jgi:hypothetical protein
MNAERSPVLDALGIEHAFAERAAVCGVWSARQVHGTELVRAPGLAPDVRADALFTLEAGCAVGVHTADCVPILLVERSRRAVAAVHAGWRGSAAGIAARSIERLCNAVGAKPRDWLAVIGPHILACCYEVDEPVRAAIEQPDAFAPAQRAGHYMLDLERVNRAQLERAGVDAEQISRLGGCTYCDRRRYPSFRRDASGDRMLHWIRL